MLFVVFAALFAGAVLVFQLTVALYRRPGHAAWLEREIVVIPLSVAFTGALAISFIGLVVSAFRLPLPVWGDAALAAGAVLFAIALAWMLSRRGPPSHRNGGDLSAST